MEFSSTQADLYSGRSADKSWKEICETVLKPAGKDIADIGCGGGIYTFAFASLGARSVVGIDKSVQYLENARTLSPNSNIVDFRIGDALSTGIPDCSIDLVFERALIHHLSKDEKESNIVEASRILRKNGILAVQDRTYENVIDNNQKYWIRSTLFECFPHLLMLEKLRRPSESEYLKMLENEGFGTTAPIKFSELRKSYSSFSELQNEILTRKGKSILFELTDDQLRFYCRELKRVSVNRSLEEIDQWTLWCAETSKQ